MHSFDFPADLFTSLSFGGNVSTGVVVILEPVNEYDSYDSREELKNQSGSERVKYSTGS